MTATTPQVDRGRFTDSQRRRAEALILVHSLFPYAAPETATRIARWICTGRSGQ